MRFSAINFVIIVSFLTYAFFTVFFYFIDSRENAIIKNSKFLSKSSANSSPISDSIDKNFWFIQLTDLHISKYSDKGRSEDLLNFCVKYIHKIKPELVIVSGDLTDSKSKSLLNSKQHISEWQTYKSIIDKSKVLKISKWLDIRGNHDSFNVPNLYHAENLYKQYSVQGKQNLQSYKYVHRTSYGTYSFVGLDSCPNPGLKRPYNFFGILSTSTAQLLQYFNQELVKDNMTVWFGHYPTSTIISPGLDLRSLIGQSATVYLCGHLHTLMKTAFNMYTLQPEGFLELELADWRDSRFFRIGVIDHDIFSFVDSRISDWPVIVVTNPKDSSFLMPHRESASKIASSTHIRIFVWSFSNSITVKVFIDDVFIGVAERVNEKHPLHVLKWNPLHYSNSSHVFRVEVQENSDVIKSVSHHFNVEGKPDWKFQKWTSAILLGDQNFNLRFIYYILWYSILLFVVVFKYLSWKETKVSIFQDNPWFVASIRFASNKHLFYPILIYLLYSVSCPLLLTELIDNHWGLVFVYGIYVSNTFLPEGSPYLSELLQNGTFILPFIFILVRNIRYDDIYISSLWKYFLFQWFYIGLLMWQCVLITYWTLIPYGILTTLLSPCRLHVITISLYMMFFSRKTKKLSTNFYECHTKDYSNNGINGNLTQINSNSAEMTKENVLFHFDDAFVSHEK